MSTRRYCKHGNRRDGNICPDCNAEGMRKRQRAADKARFKRQLAKIAGVPMPRPIAAQDLLDFYACHPAD